MRIAIATCSEKPDLTTGDQLLATSLVSLGAEVKPLIWTDAKSSDEDWDAVVVRSVWDYHKHSRKFLRWLNDLDQSSIKLFNSLQAVSWNFDKCYLQELIAKGVVCPPSVFASKDVEPDKVLEQIKAKGWHEIVVKPTISATAFLTERSSIQDANLLEKITRVQAHSDVLIQPYFKSIEATGEVSLIFFNGKSREYSHAVLKMPKGGDYRVQSDFGGTEVSFAASEKLIELAESALDQVMGGWTFARVDLIDWKERPLVSEVELIEPDLFLQFEPQAAQKLARAIVGSMS